MKQLNSWSGYSSLDCHELDRRVANSRIGTRYDWDTIFNGNFWRLTRGTDFECLSVSFQANAYTVGAKRGLKVETRSGVGGVGGDEIILRALRG